MKKRIMAKQINIEELKAMIANGIKQENLHDALPSDAVERIKNKILAMKNKESVKEIPNIVSELDVPALQTGADDRRFPDESQIVSASEENNSTGETNSFFVDAGAVPTEQPSQPTMGYVPPLPEMIQKAEPAEVFVFQYTDINENGENLSTKPLRLMNDPDVKMSMNDIWIKEAKTKADVYVAKFEKIGEINFNYTDGTSKFVPKGSEPDYVGGPEYKDNPYAAPSLPQIDEPTQANLETYIKNSVDLEKVVTNIVMDIIKNSLLTNSERAVNEDIDAAEGERGGWGTREDQLIKPMEESVNPGDEEIEFKITMQEIVENDEFERIILPGELNEKINSGDKSMLIRENSEVQEWKFGDKTYYTPVGRISKDKGYIKS
jgi:hypothetical protein